MAGVARKKFTALLRVPLVINNHIIFYQTPFCLSLRQSSENLKKNRENKNLPSWRKKISFLSFPPLFLDLPTAKRHKHQVSMSRWKIYHTQTWSSYTQKLCDETNLGEVTVEFPPAQDELGLLVPYLLETLQFFKRTGVQNLQDFLSGLLQHWCVQLGLPFTLHVLFTIWRLRNMERTHLQLALFTVKLMNCRSLTYLQAKLRTMWTWILTSTLSESGLSFLTHTDCFLTCTATCRWTWSCDTDRKKTTHTVDGKFTLSCTFKHSTLSKMNKPF